MLLCIIYTAPSAACNSCGSSSAGQSLGLLPALHKHFVGIQFLQRNFSSVHPALSETKPPELSDEYYSTFQVWGRYNIGRRIQLFAFFPFQSNRQSKDGVSTLSSGIGDVSVLANIVLLRTEDDKRWKSTLIAGGGIKAPTGKRNLGMINTDDGVPNMQPGSGAWDFVTNANYTLQSERTGLNAELSYTFTTTSENSYKYGNKMNTGLVGFYKASAGNFMLTPQAGMRCEYILHDYDNYQRKWLNEQTGGYHLFGSLGIQGFYKKTGMQVNYLLPLTQHYAGGNVKATYALNAGLFFLF